MTNSLGNRELMAQNIKRFMDAKGVTRNELCQALGFNYSTLADWLHARKYPRIDKIEKMANYFGVTKADLVEAPQKNDDLPDLNARDERQIERDLEDMMHSVSTAAYEGDTDAQEDIEAFKATLKSAMIQAKRIAKKKYTPRKYQK